MPIESIQPAIYHRPELTRDQSTEFLRRMSNHPEGFPLGIRELSDQIVQETGLNKKTVFQLFREEIESRREPDKRHKNFEVIVGYGCQHADVSKTGEILADVVIITDLPSSDFIDVTKRIYYEDIQKPAGRYLEVNPDASDDELLSVRINPSDPEDLRTVSDGVRNLLDYQHKFSDENSAKEKASTGQEWTPQQMASLIREFVKIKNHGYFLASLPLEMRRRINEDTRKKTKILCEKFQEARRRGTRVIVNPGNWDDIRSMNMIAKGDGKPQDTIPDVFDPIKYYREIGFELSETAAAYKTGNALIVTFPWFWTLSMDICDENEQIINDIIKEAEETKRVSLPVIAHIHGAPYPQFYDLSQTTPLSKYNEQFASNIRILLGRIPVDQLITSHYHMKKKGVSGEDVPLSDHYVFERTTGEITDEAFAPIHHQAWIMIGSRRGYLPARVRQNTE